MIDFTHFFTSNFKCFFMYIFNIESFSSVWSRCILGLRVNDWFESFIHIIVDRRVAGLCLVLFTIVNHSGVTIIVCLARLRIIWVRFTKFDYSRWVTGYRCECSSLQGWSLMFVVGSWWRSDWCSPTIPTTYFYIGLGHIYPEWTVYCMTFISERPIFL